MFKLVSWMKVDRNTLRLLTCHHKRDEDSGPYMATDLVGRLSPDGQTCSNNCHGGS